MSVNVNVSISFQVANAAEANAALEALGAPEGSMVSATITEVIASGLVQDGSLVQFLPPEGLPESSPDEETGA